MSAPSRIGWLFAYDWDRVAMDARATASLPEGLGFPVFAKPVKGVFPVDPRMPQPNLDGWVGEVRVHALGVVDAIMYPGAQAFMRWEDPSRLRAELMLVARNAGKARRVALDQQRRFGNEHIRRAGEQCRCAGQFPRADPPQTPRGASLRCWARTC